VTRVSESPTVIFNDSHYYFNQSDVESMKFYDPTILIAGNEYMSLEGHYLYPNHEGTFNVYRKGH